MVEQLVTYHKSNRLPTDLNDLLGFLIYYRRLNVKKVPRFFYVLFLGSKARSYNVYFICIFGSLYELYSYPFTRMSINTKYCIKILIVEID